MAAVDHAAIFPAHRGPAVHDGSPYTTAAGLRAGKSAPGDASSRRPRNRWLRTSVGSSPRNTSAGPARSQPDNQSRHRYYHHRRSAGRYRPPEALWLTVEAGPRRCWAPEMSGGLPRRGLIASPCYVNRCAIGRFGVGPFRGFGNAENSCRSAISDYRKSTCWFVHAAAAFAAVNPRTAGCLRGHVQPTGAPAAGRGGFQSRRRRFR